MSEEQPGPSKARGSRSPNEDFQADEEQDEYFAEQLRQYERKSVSYVESSRRKSKYHLDSEDVHRSKPIPVYRYALPLLRRLLDERPNLEHALVVRCDGFSIHLSGTFLAIDGKNLHRAASSGLFSSCSSRRLFGSTGPPVRKSDAKPRHSDGFNKKIKFYTSAVEKYHKEEQQQGREESRSKKTLDMQASEIDHFNFDDGLESGSEKIKPIMKSHRSNNSLYEKIMLPNPSRVTIRPDDTDSRAAKQREKAKQQQQGKQPQRESFSSKDNNRNANRVDGRKNERNRPMLAPAYNNQDEKQPETTEKLCNQPPTSSTATSPPDDACCHTQASLSDTDTDATDSLHPFQQGKPQPSNHQHLQGDTNQNYGPEKDGSLLSFPYDFETEQMDDDDDNIDTENRQRIMTELYMVNQEISSLKRRNTQLKNEIKDELMQQIGQGRFSRNTMLLPSGQHSLENRPTTTSDEKTFYSNAWLQQSEQTTLYNTVTLSQSEQDHLNNHLAQHLSGQETRRNNSTACPAREQHSVDDINRLLWSCPFKVFLYFLACYLGIYYGKLYL